MIEKKKNRMIKVYIIAVILLLIFLHFIGILNGVENYALDKLTSLQSGSFSFLKKLKYSFINYQEAKDLKKTNIDLEHQINNLMHENSELLIYKEENEQLKELLNYVEENQYDYQVAKVIGRDLYRPNTLIINKGENDGIKLGYPVIIDQGVIIGKVIDVKNDLATVLSLTDKQSQLAVSLPTTTKTIGLAQGEFGLSIKVELIPQDTVINETDIVITSGLEDGVPQGLVIGTVNRITSHENDLFKSVTINPQVDFEELTIVSVLISSNTSHD